MRRARARAAPPYKASRVLRRSELAETFAPPAWEVLCDVEAELTTRGVRTPAAFFAARRRHASAAEAEGHGGREGGNKR